MCLLQAPASAQAFQQLAGWGKGMAAIVALTTMTDLQQQPLLAGPRHS